MESTALAGNRKPVSELKEYFGYIKSKEEKLWVATFQDVAKYMRERSTAAFVHTGRATRFLFLA